MGMMVKIRRVFVFLLVLGVAAWGIWTIWPGPDGGLPEREGRPTGRKVVKTDAEWRRLLTAEEFRVTRRKGTERAFTGAYWDHHEDGVYECICCGQPLFDSRAKFDSGTGWPSFCQPAAEDDVSLRHD